MSVKIKICGLMREADADGVNSAMPDYAGFVFYEKSRRRLSGEEATAIRQRLSPNIKAVGVFVNMPTDGIVSLAKKVSLDVLQLHGDEDGDFIEELRALLPNSEIWKAVRVGDDFEPKYIDKFKNAHRLLLDAYVDGYGGKGKRIENEKIRDLDMSRNILAGGLNFQNIEDAIKTFKPYGVDVSSGVETEGLKDAKKIAEIVDKVRSISI